MKGTMTRREFMKYLSLLGLGLTTGCVEETSRAIVKYNESADTKERYSTKVKYIKVRYSLLPDIEKEQITGRITEIQFSNTNEDIIIFEDGFVTAVKYAEKYNWRMGKVYKIEKRIRGGTETNNNLIDVSLIDEE